MRLDNEATTPDMSFTIQDVPLDTQSPEYSSPSVNSSTAGQAAEFSLRWTDNEALDGLYIQH